MPRVVTIQIFTTENKHTQCFSLVLDFPPDGENVITFSFSQENKSSETIFLFEFTLWFPELFLSWLQSTANVWKKKSFPLLPRYSCLYPVGKVTPVATWMRCCVQCYIVSHIYRLCGRLCTLFTNISSKNIPVINLPHTIHLDKLLSFLITSLSPSLDVDGSMYSKYFWTCSFHCFFLLHWNVQNS